MTESVERLQIGQVMQYDGVALIARGDLLTIYCAGDAAWHRSRWVFGHAEQLIAQLAESVVGLIVVPAYSKPPDQATRAEETAAYARIGPGLRRLVVASDGGGFHGSIVRLVVSAYVRFTGRGDVFFFVRNVEERMRRVDEVKSPLTPAPRQRMADLDAARAAVAREA